jgi:hypothetical protein
MTACVPNPLRSVITFNVPVVYMALDVMILIQAIFITRAIGWGLGVGPGNRDFSGPEMASSEASAIWAQKSRDGRGWGGPSGT